MQDRLLADLERPAVLASSPVPCSGPERRFGTLREALAHARRDPAGEPAWIQTWSGAILTPQAVGEMGGIEDASRRRWLGERRPAARC